MERYGNQSNQKTSKMGKKIVKHKLSDLEEADKSFEKSKCGHFKIFDFRLMFLKFFRKS